MLARLQEILIHISMEIQYKKVMSTQIFLLQLCVELQLHFLNWELQKILCKNFNPKTLHDYFFI